MIPARRIGPLPVSAVALGCAAFSLDHADRPAIATRTIRAALDAGITLLDTALVYTPAGQENHGEKLLRRVLATIGPSERVIVSTKGGHYRDGDTFGIDGRPLTLVAHCEASLRSLGVERIDVYHLHWPDPNVPIEDSVGALAELRAAGKIDQIGVSNVSLDEVQRAQGVTTIASVQNRLSVFDQQHRDLVEHCARTGTAFLAYSPLGGAGHAASHPPSTDLAAIARAHDATPAQVALAWLLAAAPNVVPVVGASRPAHARAAAEASTLVLSAVEIDALTAARHEPRYTIRVERPLGDGWRTVLRLPEIESTSTELDHGNGGVDITLRPQVGGPRARAIVDLIRVALDPGSGPVTMAVR